MRTFLLDSEKLSLNQATVGFIGQDCLAPASDVLDLETFTHCAPILLSDGEPQVVRLYEVLMARLRLRTVSVPDGRAALDYALHRPVSLVISEIAKPHLNGIDLLKALRQDLTTCDVPFIIVTSDPHYESRLAFKSLHGNAYFTKPLNRQQFTQTVVQLLAAQLAEPTQ